MNRKPHQALACFIAAATLCVCQLPAQSSGSYTVRTDQPRQAIKGLGFEIQSDSIGSGNAGMPDATTSVPHEGRK